MLSLQRQISCYKRMQWVLIALTVGAIGAFYALIYRPEVRQLRTLEAKIEAHRSELAGTQNKTKVLPSVVAEVERLRERVGKFKTVSRQHEIGNFLADMEEASKQASLRNMVFQELPPTNINRLGGKLQDKALSISFEGDFNSIYSFLRRTEDQQRLTRIPALNIRSRDRSGQVKVSMKMNIYFQAE